jgi:hypothetical protein
LDEILGVEVEDVTHTNSLAHSALKQHPEQPMREKHWKTGIARVEEKTNTRQGTHVAHPVRKYSELGGLLDGEYSGTKVTPTTKTHSVTVRNLYVCWHSGRAIVRCVFDTHSSAKDT